MTLANWIYIFFVLAVLVAMVRRRGVVLITLLGTFVIGTLFTGSPLGGMQAIFRASWAAGTGLFDIILLIALMVSLLKAMQDMGADYLMISPLKAVLKTPTVSYFVMGIAAYVCALFFWPTPASALVGTVLIPIAVRSGLSAMGAAMSINLFAHGMGLSGDLIIQGAPALTSRAAGVDFAQSLTLGGILSIVSGVTAGLVGYFMIRKEITRPGEGGSTLEEVPPPEFGRGARFIAVAVPVGFTLTAVFMVLLNIRASGSSSLLGGVAVLFIVIISVLNHGHRALENMESYVREGLLFSVSIFSAVIPIAGFFYLGSPENAPRILGEGAPGLLFEIGKVVAEVLPLSALPLAFGMLLIGLVAGLDGSGFSGLPLVGTLANSLGNSLGIEVAALAAIGQMATVWCGGGTLVAWAVVAVAGIAGVSPLDLARRNFVPTLCGLLAGTVVGAFML